MITAMTAAAAAVILLLFCYHNNQKSGDRVFERTGEVLYNPMMGYAPDADYKEAVGDNTLVYVGVSWRELEPVEGQYDFARINEKNHLETWRKQGKNVVFRFYCDNPSEEKHMDIPDWLYEKTGDGTFYDTEYGKGYSPDYNNKVLIECHRRAIEALGKEYGQDHFFCFIELGSLGHWGEWHVNFDAGIARIPGEKVCMQYIEPYLDAFPNAKLLMRRPFEAVSNCQLGVYNDMTGAEEDTEEWLSWIKDGGVYEEAAKPLRLTAIPEIWNTSPVGGEFTSSITMKNMLVTHKIRTKKLLKKSHMTFIGPKCPIDCEEEQTYPKNTDDIRRLLGYCYGVSHANTQYDETKQCFYIELCLENYGVAPMYEHWPVCLYLLGDNDEVISRYETDIQLSELTGGESLQRKFSVLYENQKDGKLPRVCVGIENPETGEPEVNLDMRTAQYHLRYLLWEEENQTGRR